MLRVIFFNYFVSISFSSFILNSYLPTCNYKLPKHSDITVFRKDWRISNDNTELIFNLCTPVSNAICGKHMACLINKVNKEITFFNGTFNRTDDKLILGSNASHSELTIKWDCSLSTENETKVLALKDSVYEVTLMSLSNDCLRPCTTILNAQLLDFSALKNKYIVNSGTKIFSIYLCGMNPDCGNTSSVCDITNRANVIPISSGNEQVRYDEDAFEVKFHKKTKFHKSEKIFELFIKCNWSADVYNLHYKEAAQQGKYYRFEMESSYGCVKLPPICEKSDKFYKYNLTKAYNSSGYIEVKDVPEPRKIFLNICGPLQLPESDNICMKSFSQVCEINGNRYVNRGSIYSNQFVISDEKISASLISGSKCNNETYKTTIDFHCSKTETHPRFLKEENCELFLTWNTPAACPEPNLDSCASIRPEPFKCITYNGTYNDSYNLTELNKPYGYVFRNKHVEYHLNICGYVKDPEAPCKKNAMILAKYLDEYDIRKKIKSFGTFNKIRIDGQHLVVESRGGDFCKESLNYKGTIYFECSDKESDISLTRNTTCELEFLWKTKHACPTKIASTKSCVFRNPLGEGYTLDFTHLPKTSLITMLNDTKYLFDVCGDSKSKCPSENCTYVPADKTIIIHENKTYLEFYLNRSCDGNNVFNKATFELVCDHIRDNEHFKMIGIEGCTLLFHLKTSQVCFDEEIIIPLVDRTPGNIHYDVDTDTIPTQLSPNCTVKNHYTGYEFNIRLLNINVSSSKCPSFNIDSQMVYLVYDLPKSCHKDNGERGPLDFRIMLKCKNSDFYNTTTNGICARNLTIELPQACKLLEKTILNNSTVPRKFLSSVEVGAIVVAVIVTIALILVCIYFVYKRRRRTAYSTIHFPYVKDGDL